MDIHEHQAKELFKLYNIPTPEGKAVFSVEDATKAANELPGPVYVVKAQIHAGGRGKAGGVKVVKDLDAVKTAAQSILGKNLITPQTGSGASTAPPQAGISPPGGNTNPPPLPLSDKNTQQQKPTFSRTQQAAALVLKNFHIQRKQRKV